jgi:hypothetical protein
MRGISTKEFDFQCLAFGSIFSHYAIDDFLGHFSPCRPFASGNKHGIGFWIFGNDMISTCGSSQWGMRIDRQWSPPPPGTENIGASYLEIGRQVLATFVKQPFDFVFGWIGQGFGRSFGVGGSNQGMFFPRQHEKKSTVTCIVI